MTKRVVAGVVGVLALLAAGYFGYLTLRGTPAAPAQAAATPTHQMVSRQGGFRIGVPQGMSVTRKQGTVTLTSRGRDLAVTVGRAGPGTLRRTAHRFVRSLRHGYHRVRVLGRQRQHVDGRKALATYGHAVNGHHVKVRFVTVTVQARPRNYAITAFAGYRSDPSTVLPRVDAIAGTFHVLR